MKKIKIFNLCICIFLTTAPCFGQFEIKTSPFYLIFRIVDVNVEYGLKPTLGIEAAYQFGKNTWSENTRNEMVFGALKHYFIKKKPALSRVYLGAYSSYGTFDYQSPRSFSFLADRFSFFSIGATGGLKTLIGNDHVVLEAGLNIGKRTPYHNGKPMQSSDFSTSQARFFAFCDVGLRLMVGYRF